MSIRSVIKKAGVRTTVAVAMGAAVLGLAAAPASASTIQNGWLQFCVQGPYDAFVHVLSTNVPNSGGMMTREFLSTVMGPGECHWWPVNTLGQWAQVDVVQVKSNGSQRWINDVFYNSNTGLGVGATGTSDSPWVNTW
ncbi:MAG: hypothetical protein QOE51_1591 [Actinoplanes sp.]|nr:hypothetical protein [Actinoplanes sp.]